MIEKPSNNNIEEARSPEIIESERTAMRKLEKLMAEDFKTYGVRFVNIGEYEAIVAHGFRSKIEVSEDVFLGNHMARGESKPPFKDYVEANKGSWIEVAFNQTGEWAHANYNMTFFDWLLRYLRDAHKTEKKHTIKRVI